MAIAFMKDSKMALCSVIKVIVKLSESKILVDSKMLHYNLIIIEVQTLFIVGFLKKTLRKTNF